MGLLTFHIEAGDFEIVTLNSQRERRGIGTALLEQARFAASSAKCRRMWLVTTNDNRPATDFYRRRGFSIVAVHRGAVDLSRRLKPEIPERGLGGIPIRDEIELEIRLGAAGA